LLYLDRHGVWLDWSEEIWRYWMMGAVSPKVLTESAVRWRRWLRLLALVGVLALAGAVLLPAGLATLGRWLVVADSLEHAAAVVVLTGEMPFRAMEGAALYREGWAPEVWLTRQERALTETALARLGIEIVREHEFSRQVLVRSGVPDSAVRLLDGGVVNTVDEMRVIARELERIGAERVIIVTSRFHTRRVRATWRALVGDSPVAVVRPARDDQYDPEAWWRSTRDVLAVSREVFALVNVWAGFPVQPDRR
jgi:uncharacterized SAM-binding protein YcdF (DUF218 family)